MRINELKPIFSFFIPQRLEEGLIYISTEYDIAVHLCACGCGVKSVMPLGKSDGWQMKNDNGVVSFTPSVGNFNPPPYHAHYYITNNKIEWL